MISVVLVRPETPANIGFISRAMANFDLQNLILINPLCSHLGEDSLKVSKHSKQILKSALVKDESYLDKLKNDFDLVVGTTSVLGSDYNIPRTPFSIKEFSEKYDASQNIAIVFGNEGTGLSNNEIKKCDFLITIPSSRKYPALNISHAAAVIFYELYMASGKNKINSHIKKASPKERGVLLGFIYKIIDMLDFATVYKKETQKKAWKNIVEKSMMSKREAYSAIGLLKKLYDRLKLS